MKQVKYFEAEDATNLENEINRFLKDTECNYVDLKFQSELSSPAYGDEILLSAILVYEIH